MGKVEDLVKKRKSHDFENDVNGAEAEDVVMEQAQDQDLVVDAVEAEVAECVVHLSHPWCDTPVQVGDPVNVIDGVIDSSSSGVPHVYLDHRQGLLVLHPDVLLSAHGSQLNQDQVAVLTRVLALNEYCLVLGMP
eukprot:gene14649-14797_t